MIIGWDISTSAIGVCVKDDAGVTLEFGVIYPEGDSQHLKQISAAGQVDEFCKRARSRYSPDRGPTPSHFVEDRLGGFTGGLTTRQTLMSLAAMNAVVSFVLSGHGGVVHVPPISAKRIGGLKVPKGGDKKAAVIELVRSVEPSFPYAETRAGNAAKGVDDMADAWLLAETGRRLLHGEATLGQSKQAEGRRGKAGKPAAGGPKEGRVRVPVPRKAGDGRVQQRP